MRLVHQRARDEVMADVREQRHRVAAVLQERVGVGAVPVLAAQVGVAQVLDPAAAQAREVRDEPV